ncbi:uridine kinase family protein [Streptomyces sp. NPDC055144]
MEPTPETYTALASRIRAAAPRCGPVRLVAVDGPSGAGKSTFAERLAGALGSARIVHTDDFASWDDPLGWWPRLEEQVLQPLGSGVAGRFQRYDWVRRELAEWHDVPVGHTLVLEGVSTARGAVADRLTCAVWVETGRAVRLRRGLTRDGEDALPLWRTWMAAEDEHFAQDGTRERADVVVDGNPHTAPADPAHTYMRLR